MAGVLLLAYLGPHLSLLQGGCSLVFLVYRASTTSTCKKSI